MDVYYFVILITLLLCYLIKVPYGDKKAYLKKVIWVFMPLAIFGALRYDFGNDYGEYERLFYKFHGNVVNISKDEHVEIGYQWLNFYVPTWRLMLILVSTTVVGAYVMLYSKYVESKMLFLAVFFTMLYPDQTFYMQFVSMRNGLVMAGLWLCLPLIIEKKYILVLALAYALSFIHTSALIFIPMALIVGRSNKLTKKELYIIVGIILLLMGASMTTMINILDVLMGNVEQFESYKIHYLEADNHSSLINITVNIVLMSFIFSWAYRNKKNLTPSQNAIWRLSLLYLLAPFLGSLGRIRMTYFFIPFYIMTITYVFGDKNVNKLNKYVFLGVAIITMLYATFIVWIGNPHFKFQHYTSIFG